MKSIIDRSAIQQRASIAHAASLGGLIILIGSVAFSLVRSDLATVSIGILVVGCAVSAVGVYLANRWVKRPRPEDVLDKVLKSLSDQCRLYHYLGNIDHLLLMPSGVVVIEVINQDGFYTYSDGRWKQKMTMGRALRVIFEERLGDPIQRAQSDAARIARILSQRIARPEPIPSTSLVAFIHPAAVVEAKGSPVPVCIPKTLAKKIPTNLPAMPGELYQEIQAVLDEVAAKKARLS